MPHAVHSSGPLVSATEPTAQVAPRAPGELPVANPDLVLLAAVTWNFPLVGRTRMLTEAWLRMGRAATFVQVPSLRTGIERLAITFRPAKEGPVVRPWPIYPARSWPFLTESLLRRAVRLRARELRRQLDARICWSRSVALVVSPVWTPWLAALPFKHVVYDCIDDVSVHTPRPALALLYQKWEDELVRRATGAVATCRPLLEALRARRPDLRVATIRNGVDVERFQSRARSAPRPPDLLRGSRPVVGFVGALYEWIDWKLIAEVARALPDYDFVFVGPHDEGRPTDIFARIENVSFLGARPYEQVPAYVQAFDVCWVPFDQSRAARAANPVKIYEYLALGKPVVSTPVADVESFEDHILVGRGPLEISALLRAALGEAENKAAARVRFAQANSWEARAAEYLAFVASLAG